MGLNDYDEAVDALQATPGPDEDPRYKEAIGVLRQRDTGGAQQLKVAAAQAADTNPDRAADVQRLSRQLAIPAPIVERNYDTYKKRADQQALPIASMQRQTPTLAEWMAQPDNHAVAKDDMEQLGALEWLFTAPQRAFAQGVNQVRYGQLAAESIFHPLTQEQEDAKNSYKFGMEDGGALGAEGHWFRGAVTGTMRQAWNTLGNPYAIIGGVGGLAIGGAGGAVVGGPPGALAGALEAGKVGFQAGGIYGTLKGTFALEAGLAYDEYRSFKDEHGQPLDPDIAKMAAIATGAINAPLEVIGTEFLLKSIPGLDKLTGVLTKDAVKTALKSPTVRAALGNALKTYGKTLTAETSQELAQEAVTIMSGELAKYVGAKAAVPGQLEQGNINLFKQPRVANQDGSTSTVDSISVGMDGKEVLLSRVTPDGRHLSSEEAVAEYQKTGQHLGVFDTPAAADAFAQQLHADYAAGVYDRQGYHATGAENFQRMVDTGLGAVQSFALMVAPGPIIGVEVDRQRAKNAQAATDFVKALGEGAANSKTLARMPAAAQAFIAQATKDGPLENLYTPTETWVNYWQSQGVDPGKMADEVTGQTDALAKAQQAGVDLKLPTARYAVTLAPTEHNQFFADEIRLAPDQMNRREADAFEAEQKAKAKAERETAQPSATDAIKTAVSEQLVNAGVEPGTAASYSELYGAVSNMAERAGVDPAELFASYGLKIDRAGMSVSLEETAAPKAAEATVAETGQETGQQPAQEEIPGLAALEAGLHPDVLASVHDASTASPNQSVEVNASGESEASLEAQRVLAGMQERGEKYVVFNRAGNMRDLGLNGRDYNTQPGETYGVQGPDGFTKLEDRGGHVPASKAPGFIAEVKANKAKREQWVSDVTDAFNRDGIVKTEHKTVAGLSHVIHQSTKANEQGERFQVTSFDGTEPIGDVQFRTLAEAANFLTGERIVDNNTAAADTGATNAAAELQAGPPAGQDVRDSAAQQPAADTGGSVEGPSDGDGVERRRLPAPGATELWKRKPKEENEARFTPEVTRELERIAGELEEFPQTKNTWTWLSGKLTGNVGGGHANKVKGDSGAKVFGDIKLFSPANKITSGKNKGEVGNEVSGNIATAAKEIRAALASRDITRPMVEGAMRVAERRAINDYRYIEHPELPPHWGVVAETAFTNELSSAIDDELSAVNMLDVDSFENDALEPEGDVDTSFNVDEFDQSLFPELTEPDPVGDKLTATTKQPPTATELAADQQKQQQLEQARQQGADLLDTGELQPRLTGAGEVRDLNLQTPEFEAPFALTSEVAKPGKKNAGQKTLFQSAYHGSPHEFDRFSLQHIGTGEGNQSYGWGLYFAGLREVADGYRRTLSQRRHGHTSQFQVGDKIFADVPRYIIDRLTSKEATAGPGSRTWNAAIDELLASNREDASHAGTMATLVTQDQNKKMWLEEQANRQNIVDALEAAKAAQTVTAKQTGRTFTVEIPDDSDFLDWDKPASQQSPKVQAALHAMGLTWEPFKLKTVNQMIQWFNGPAANGLGREDVGIRMSLREGYYYAEQGNETALRNWQWQHQGYFRSGNIDPIGESLYGKLQFLAAERGTTEKKLENGRVVRTVPTLQEQAKAASEMLRDHDLAGIRYLDGGSRAAGEGTYNYVVVDDQLVQVKEYDQADRALTNDDVQQWTKDLKERVGKDLTVFDVFLTSRGDLQLDTIAVDRGAARAGLGSKVMLELTRFADQHGLRIVLSPADKGYHPAANTPVTSSYNRLVKFYQRFGFVRNAGRNIDFTMRGGMYREPTVSAATTSSKPAQTSTPAFRQWFGNSKVVDDSGKPLVVYHGTTGNFTTFDRSRSNVEADLGAGFYFSNEAADVEANYAGIGPDLEQKIQLRVERIEGEYDYDPEVKARVDAYMKENGVSVGEAAIHLARQDEGYEHGGATMPVFLKIENPVELGGDNATFFDAEYGPGEDEEDLGEPTGKLIEFVTHIRDIAAEYSDGNTEVTDEMLMDGIDRGGITAQQAIEQLSNDERFGYATDDEGKLASHEIIRRALEAMGYDGVIDHTVDSKFGSQRRTGKQMVGMNPDTVHYVAFEPTQIKSAIGNRGTFNPNEPNILQQPRRGSIRFGPGRQVSIDLLERADLSTFLHETGHFFLEMMGDLVESINTLDEAQRTDQQRGLVTDYAKLLEWFGVTSRDGIDTPQHEQMARGFEAYLMSGEAPSVGLDGAFARFRAWLVGIYKSVKALNVQLTPEVRSVFDRLLVSDQAIQQAEARRGVSAMFTTAESAGMTESAFGLYKDTIAKASRTAREELDRKLLNDVRREQEATYKKQKAEVRAQVEAEVNERREYRALAAMQKGTNADGSAIIEGLETPPMKLSKQILVDRYGTDRLARLPKPFIYTREGGLDPNVVATAFGFSSGDEMLDAVEHAPARERVISAVTEQRMLAEHGSLLLDGTLYDAATAAISNEDRDLVIRQELRALAQLRRTVHPFVAQAQAEGKAALAAANREREYERRWLEAEAKLRVAIAEGRKQAEIDALKDEISNLKRKARGGAVTINAALPPAGAVERVAKFTIAGMRIGDIRAETFWSASRRAAKAAIEKAARQDFDGAIIAKQQELLNLAMYREAERVKDDIATRVKFAKSLADGPARAALGKAGGNYLDQVDAVLDRFDFAKASAKVLERRSALRDFLAGLEATGQEAAAEIPEELLDEAKRTHYTNLTVDELTGVTDGLKQLVYLARLKNRLLKAQDAREFGIVRDEVTTSINFHNTVKPRPIEFRAVDRKWLAISSYFASHHKISELAHQLDGGQDGGAMWTHIIKPLNDAANVERERRSAAGTSYAAILERFYPKGEIATWSELLHVPAIGTSISKEARLSVALNWGNETSRDRLLADPSRRWKVSQVEAILDTLDKRDWDFVQATWDHINTFWPDIVAKQERVTGIAPEKVEAATVTTKFGDYAGGYYPLVYDSRLSLKAKQREAATDLSLATSAAYLRTTTKRGHVQARQQNVKDSVKLEVMAVVGQHMEQVIHDLTHHETLIDVQRILRDPSVSKAILDTRGDAVYQQFSDALQAIAVGNAPARNTLDRAANWVRSRTQLAMLGFNLWTALQQPLGMFNGMATVGPRWVAKGLGRWLIDASHMESTTKWIADVSPFMRDRTNNATQDINDLRASFNETGGWFDTLVRKITNDHVTKQTILEGYLWHISLAQRVADVPTWLGGYEKAKANGETEERAVAMADQAVIDSQGSGDIKDLANVQRGGAVAKLFMTFYSYGNTVFNATARATNRAGRSPAAAIKALGDLSLIYLAPAIGTVALAHAFGKRPPDDDAGDWMTEVGQEILSTALNTMVFVRELGGLVGDGARGYAGPAGTRLVELIYRAAGQIEQGEVDEALIKSLNAVAGVLFRYPAAQAQRTADGIAALEEGRTSNPLVLLTGGPPKKAAQ